MTHLAEPPHAEAVEVRLARGAIALVDAADADRVLSAGPWHPIKPRNVVYASRRIRHGNGKSSLQMLHTFITGWGYIDHINRDGLDNRRANLRQATNAENQRNRGPQANNTSGFKGVSWDIHRGVWFAAIKHEGRQRFLGRYAVAEDAARAYDRAAADLHGEFAWLNFTNPKQVTP